jgi:hypothetical protein
VTAVVRWRAADGSGAGETLVSAPAENRGFVELRTCLFQRPAPGWSFRIDDEPLCETDGGEWSWEPGFFAGMVTAELLDEAGATRATFLLDVSPDRNKVGAALFHEMVEEIWHEAPELVLGSEPATTMAGALHTSEDPWLAFARLRRHGPDLVRALTALAANPRRALRVCRDAVPLRRVRTVDSSTAAQIVRSPAAALFADDAEAPYVRMEDCYLDVPVADETLDCAANRAMFALVVAVLRRANSLLVRLQHDVEHEANSETRTLLARRWPVRKEVLDRLAHQLKRVLRRRPFTEVSRPEVTAAGLTAVSADPVYARAWSRGWRALRRGIDGGDATDRMWISPTWEIYERWCYVRLGRMLAETQPEWGWKRNAGVWRGTRCGSSAQLMLQPTFPSRPAQHDGMWSISKERVPDLVLRVDSPDGTRFVIVDAKYRTSRAAVLDAMESAHIYQDSLRIGSRRPDASLLLVPAGGGASWLEDEKFHDTHRVGVHVMAPGQQIPMLTAIRVALA